MRYLLDVNILIGLLDSQHRAHHVVLDWFLEHGRHAWASSPTTQNGVIRIMSQPSYGPTRLDTVEAGSRLRSVMESTDHQSIVDDVSLIDSEIVDLARIRGGGAVTGTFLLALAVSHGLHFATLEGRLDPSAVRDGATHLIVISG